MVQSPWLVLYNAFAWIVCYIVTRYYSRRELNAIGVSNKQFEPKWFVYLLFLLNSLFIFYGGDNGRYQESVLLYSNLANIDSEGLGGLEMIYRYLAFFVKGNYLLWKVVVYGLGLVFVYVISLRLRINNYLFLYSFTLFVLTSYGSSRSVVAVLVYLLGLSFIEKRKKIQSLIGFAISICSIYFHSSLVLPVVLLPTVFIKVTRKSFFILLALLPFAIELINNMPEFLYGNENFMDTSAGEKFANYTDGNVHGSGDSILRQVHDYLTYIVVGILLFFSIKADNKHRLSSTASAIVRASFFLAYFAIVTGLSKIPGKWVLFYRYIEMILPILFVIWPIIYLDRNVLSKQSSIRYEYIALLWNIVFLFKIVYHTVV